MNVRRLQSIAVAAIVAGAAVATAFGRGVPAGILPHPIVTPIGAPILHTPPPLPIPPLLHPTPTPSALPGFPQPQSNVRAPGSIVPLSELPRLPMRTAMNTLHPGQRQIQAATGATILLTASGSTSCGITAGDNFTVGCTADWQSSGLTGGDTFQDYYIAPNVADGTAGTTVGGGYGAPSGSVHATALSVAGVYTFGVLDTTTNQWVAVIYINVSVNYNFGVYQDAFHTQLISQFAAGTSSAAYIYATNITPSDFYVVYIESTSINPVCIFSAPVQSSYTANALCQPNLSSGEQAPGGNLSVTWPISSTQPAGTYSVVLFDKTTNERIAQQQISVTGPSGETMLLYP
ncbi:MAG: hypothetical protein ACP5O6_07400, partial [Candidatus Baltobacteraceae bacterium]